MNKYLFFLRHYNDIDNIIPVIYFLLAKNDDSKVCLIIYSTDYDYKRNRLIQYIKQKFDKRILIKWIGDVDNYPYAVTKNKNYRKFNLRIKNLFKITTLEDKIKKGEKIDSLKNYFIKLFNEFGFPNQVIFDQNRTSYIKGLINSLRQLGIKRIISLPVSPWMNNNVLRQVDFIKLDASVFKSKHDYSGFDKIGQVDSFYSDNLDKFFTLLGEESPFKNKVTIIGSIRYSKEWLVKLSSKELESYLPPPKSKSKKPSVLVLPSHPKNNSFWDEYQRTVQFLSQFENYDFIIKPHTRYDTAYRNLPVNMEVDAKTNTSILIDWADIILYWSTSVALEGFQKKKIMVCLDYINGNESTYSKLSAGLVCKSRDDLLHFMINGDENNFNNGYQNIIDKVIKAPNNKSIVNNYLDFINNN